MKRFKTDSLIAATSLLATIVAADEPVDYDMVNRIRDEGFHHSQVMEIAEALTEGIGPRLTGSPQMKQANDWTRDKLEEWGLESALEPFEHGRGWSFTTATIHMSSPLTSPLLALPVAWTPGTDGVVRAPAMRVSIDSVEDFEEYRGKLAGKILFLDKPRKVEEPKGPIFQRYTDDELEGISEYVFEEGRRPDFRDRFLKRLELRKPLADFLVEEKAVATVRISSRNNGLVNVTGNRAYKVGENPGVTGLVMAAEHYNRILRMLDEGKRVELELEVDARFHEDDTNAYNTVGELQGTDLADEIVMLGAHLDSWHAGSGATDNGAGSSVALESVRILKALGVQPRRTIRIVRRG